jgi:co-chaperonin GroES (HSP10)
MYRYSSAPSGRMAVSPAQQRPATQACCCCRGLLLTPPPLPSPTPDSLCPSPPPSCNHLQQIIPKGDRVLVKVAEQEQKTRGGILLPVSAQKRPTSGEVVGLGDGRQADGSTRPFFLKEGQTVRAGDAIVCGATRRERHGFEACCARLLQLHPLERAQPHHLNYLPPDAAGSLTPPPPPPPPGPLLKVWLHVPGPQGRRGRVHPHPRGRRHRHHAQVSRGGGGGVCRVV